MSYHRATRPVPRHGHLHMVAPTPRRIAPSFNLGLTLAFTLLLIAVVWA